MTDRSIEAAKEAVILKEEDQSESTVAAIKGVCVNVEVANNTELV